MTSIAGQPEYVGVMSTITWPGAGTWIFLTIPRSTMEITGISGSLISFIRSQILSTLVGSMVVESKYIHASNPDDAESFYEPANDKVYRHPTFYDLPDELKHM